MSSIPDDPRCRIKIEIDRSMQREIEELLNPETIGSKCGCKVIKHPDCCRLCRINNDCNKIPMHFNCRCVRQYECYA